MKCGFYKQDITPRLGCRIAGYPAERLAEGILDPLYVRCTAFRESGTAIFLCFDLLGIPQQENRKIREYVAEYVGCEVKDVFVSCTHTHTGPNLSMVYYPIETQYLQELKHYAAHAAQAALDDLREATFFYSRSEVHDISFVRRYRMKDGTVRTNPGRNNPDVLEPMNPGDDTLQLLKIVREDAPEILLINYQVHADTVGGNGICADYPGVVCQTLEAALPNVKCMYLLGTSGDLNHINIHAPSWMPYKGKTVAEHMGRKIAGEILSIYTFAQSVSVGTVKTVEKRVALALKRPTEEELTRSRAIMEARQNGTIEALLKDKVGMDRNIFLMEANNIVEVHEEGTERIVSVSGVRIGDLCLIGFPGDPFCAVGKQIRQESPFAVQLVCELTNGMEGYFPTEDAYQVNGYESRTSKFMPGVAETLTAAAKEIMKELSESH